MKGLRRTTVAGSAGLALAAAALFAAAVPASATTDAAQIAEACGAQQVCLFDGGSISNASELESALPEGVRVVVIPEPDQAQSVPSSSIASQLQATTGANTVIVIEDRATDRFAVASNDDATAITEALYSQGATDGGVAVASIAQTLAPGTAEEPAASFPLGAVAGVGGALIALIVVGVVTAVALRSRKRSGRAAMTRKVEKELAASLHGDDGEFVRRALEQLEDRARALPDLAPKLDGLVHHLSELFVRASKRGTDQQLRLLQSRYKDTLAKLLKALADDYYGDIVRNPHYWSGPEERLQEVRRAVDSVDAEAVENVRQVNESRDLEFQVALDSLIRTVDEARLSDVYSDREQ